MVLILRHSRLTAPAPQGFVWPNASNTGVPAGQVLVEYSALPGGGPDLITDGNWASYFPNKLCTNKIIRRQLDVLTSGFTFRNCHFYMNSFWGINAENGLNLTVQDCLFQGLGTAGNTVAPILGQGLFERIHSYGANMAILVTGGATTARFNYFHDMGHNAALPHYDGFFVGGFQTNCLFEDNYIVLPQTSGTAHMFIHTQDGPSTGPIMVRHNRFLGRPSYPCYSTSHNSSFSGTVTFDRNELEVGDYRVSDGAGGWSSGYFLIQNVNTICTGNVDAFSGANVDYK